MYILLPLLVILFYFSKNKNSNKQPNAYLGDAVEPIQPIKPEFIPPKKPVVKLIHIIADKPIDSGYHSFVDSTGNFKFTPLPDTSKIFVEKDVIKPKKPIVKKPIIAIKVPVKDLSFVKPSPVVHKMEQLTDSETFKKDLKKSVISIKKHKKAKSKVDFAINKRVLKNSYVK